MKQNFAAYFSPDYLTARRRFIGIAQELGCRLDSHSIGQIGAKGEDLTIDAAIWGSDTANDLLVLTSGIHGGEGFFGSAVQLATLDQILRQQDPQKLPRILLVHSLNPYGFSYLRRANEENIDLNRNFLLSNQNYRGSPEAYKAINSFLNPSSPGKFDFFISNLIIEGLTRGFGSLKAGLTLGQYDFPRGLFFGGHHPSATMKIMEQYLPQWVGSVKRILHIDLHTGLGASGSYKLLFDNPLENPIEKFLLKTVGKHNVEISGLKSKDLAYKVSGGLPNWGINKFSHLNYTGVTYETGTYGFLKVLKTLRSENSAHFYFDKNSKPYLKQKNNMQEVFAPRNIKWRNKVISDALNLIEQTQYIFKATE